MAFNKDPEQPIMDYEVESLTWEDCLREIEQFDWSKDSKSLNKPEDHEQALGEASTANTVANPMAGVVPSTPGKPPVLTPSVAPMKKVRHSLAGSEMDWEPTPAPARKPIARQLFADAKKSSEGAASPLASGLGFPSDAIPSITVEPKTSASSRPAATHEGQGEAPVADQGKGKARATAKVEEQEYIGPVTRGKQKASSMQDKTKASSSKQPTPKPDKSSETNQYAGPVTRGRKKASGSQSDVDMADANEDSN